MNQNNTTSKLITENNEIFNLHTNPQGTWWNLQILMVPDGILDHFTTS